MSNQHPGVQPGTRALLQQGVAAHRAGQLAQALQSYRAATKLDPRFADAHHLLASALSQSGQHDDAERAIRRALELDPSCAEFHATRGKILLAAGRIGRARDALREATRREPKNVGYRFQLAMVHERGGEFADAEKEYHAALALDARNARLWSNLGVVQIHLARPDDAETSLRRAVELEPALLAGWVNLARAQRDAGRHHEALASLTRATALAPADALVQANLGQTLREIGRIDEAIAAFRRAIELAPNAPTPRVMLAMTKKHVERDAELAWLEAAVRDPKAAGLREHDARFAHAKVLDDLGDADAAFEELVRANASRRATFAYSIEDDVARFRRIREVFGQDAIERLSGGGCPDSSPVFVVGMPRSGTSLVEQVLASHPEVFGAGETEHLRRALESPDLAGGYPEAFVGVGAEALRAAGARYVERLRRSAPPVARIVDKSPLNFQRLGAIRAVLPNARVIHCTRDARDTCLSIFRQNFEADLPFAFDLREIGRYWRLYDELMAHWRSVLGDSAVLEVRYEDLVDDLETQARRMLAWLGLPFDPACLTFHATPRAVRTASLQQVRQPIYRSSIDGWQRFESRLGPLLDELGRA